jgi:hypothetical protein
MSTVPDIDNCFIHFNLLVQEYCLTNCLFKLSVSVAVEQCLHLLANEKGCVILFPVAL